jgi:hypothetical protein
MKNRCITERRKCSKQTKNIFVWKLLQFGTWNQPQNRFFRRTGFSAYSISCSWTIPIPGGWQYAKNPPVVDSSRNTLFTLNAPYRSNIRVHAQQFKF